MGGLTLAAFLTDSGIDYEIVEKSSDWSNQGYSIGMWNNGRHILAKLGLDGQFDAGGTPIRDYYIYDGKGKLLRKYNLTHFRSDYGMALCLVGRKGLHDWLFSRIESSKVTMGRSVNSISQDAEKVQVVFSDGQVKEYDLVVGADGIHSSVRNLCFQDKVMATSMWRVWWMWVDNKYKTKASVTEYIEPGEFVSLFDSGERTLAIIAGLSNGILWDDPKGRIERLRNTFKDETAVSPGIFESLKDADINPADLIHIKLRSWIHGRVVLLGDAAHGFEPHAGIGGSMALEDGYVLAGELMKVSDSYSLEEALHSYQARRKGRVAVAQKLTARMKAWGLIKSKWLRRVVNLCVPYFPESIFVNEYNALLKEEI